MHDKKKLQSRYNVIYPLVDRLLKKMLLSIKTVLDLPSPPSYKARIKDFNTYYKKILHHKTFLAGNGNLPLLDDLIGIRVICVFLEDLNIIAKEMEKRFEVLEIEDKGANKKVSEFLYESIHLTVRIPKSIIDEVLAEAQEDMSSFGELNNLTCEIQLRTILQDAWAEVEHELVYKSEFSPFDLPMRRKLASINASLNLADIVFQELRDYQNKLNAEVAMRRQNFYHQADEATALDGLSSIQGDRSKTIAAPMPPSPFLRGTIDELLLDGIHVHNLGDYDRAISIYSRIINFDPPPPAIALSVIYKHRGMAHFSRHDYDEALGDFTISLQHNPENFQAQYYSGIVHSLRGDDEKALECFSKSLAISPYQAHVHYRKALAEYNLGQYQAALITLEECIKLGFEDDEVKRLNAKLIEKFDMKV